MNRKSLIEAVKILSSPKTLDEPKREAAQPITVEAHVKHDFAFGELRFQLNLSSRADRRVWITVKVGGVTMSAQWDSGKNCRPRVALMSRSRSGLRFLRTLAKGNSHVV